jgi:hypothetical protein
MKVHEEPRSGRWNQRELDAEYPDAAIRRLQRQLLTQGNIAAALVDEAVDMPKEAARAHVQPAFDRMDATRSRLEEIEKKEL